MEPLAHAAPAATTAAAAAVEQQEQWQQYQEQTVNSTTAATSLVLSSMSASFSAASPPSAPTRRAPSPSCGPACGPPKGPSSPPSAASPRSRPPPPPPRPTITTTATTSVPAAWTVTASDAELPTTIGAGAAGHVYQVRVRAFLSSSWAANGHCLGTLLPAHSTCVHCLPACAQHLRGGCCHTAGGPDRAMHELASAAPRDMEDARSVGSSSLRQLVRARSGVCAMQLGARTSYTQAGG